MGVFILQTSCGTQGVVVGFKGGNLGFPKAHLQQIARTVTLFFLLFPAVPVPVFAKFGTIQAIGAASPRAGLTQRYHTVTVQIAIYLPPFFRTLEVDGGDGGMGHWVAMGWDGFELRYYIGIVRGSLLRMGKFQLMTALPETISMGRICFLFGEARDAERLHLHICLHHHQPLPHPPPARRIMS